MIIGLSSIALFYFIIIFMKIITLIKKPIKVLSICTLISLTIASSYYLVRLSQDICARILDELVQYRVNVLLSDYDVEIDPKKQFSDKDREENDAIQRLLVQQYYSLVHCETFRDSVREMLQLHSATSSEDLTDLDLGGNKRK